MSEDHAQATVIDIPPTIDLMLGRRHAAVFVGPEPDEQQLRLILQSGTTGPDHGGIRPWRFVVIRGDARHRFGEALAQSALAFKPNLPQSFYDKARGKATIAPLLIALIASPNPKRNVPVWEQTASAACTGFGMIVAANALGLAAIWKSAPYVDQEPVRACLELGPDEQLLGWVNVGHHPEDAAPTERNWADLTNHVRLLEDTGTSGYTG